MHEAILRADCPKGWFRSSAARQVAGCRKPHAVASDSRRTASADFSRNSNFDPISLSRKFKR